MCANWRGSKLTLTAQTLIWCLHMGKQHMLWKPLLVLRLSYFYLTLSLRQPPATQIFSSLLKTRSEVKLCEDTRSDPQLQKAKAQHAYCQPKQTRIQESQASRDPRWSYGDYLQRLYRQTSGRPYSEIKKLTHKLNEHSIRHASALIKTRYALQCNTSNNSQELGPGATAHAQPPWPTLFSF